MDEDEVLFEVWNSKSKRVAGVGDFEKLPEEFQRRVRENFSSQGIRNAYREGSNGAVRLVFAESHPEFQGNKAIARACAVYLSLVSKFEKIAQSERQHSEALLRRFAHNLTKLQRTSKDTMGEIVSDKAKARSYADFKDEVKRRIEGNTAHAADVMCRMSHRTIDLDAQIETLRIISGFADDSAPATPLQTDLQRAMFRLTNPFVDRLREKNVGFNLQIPQAGSSKGKVWLIHSLFGAAIWQFLDNASKYVRSGTVIDISAALDARPQTLVFEMMSVRIEDGEFEKIFLERYTGKNAKQKAGNGIGMFIVKKALELMGASISVSRLKDEDEHEGTPYARHRFTITFRNE